MLGGFIYVRINLLTHMFIKVTTIERRSLGGKPGMVETGSYYQNLQHIRGMDQREDHTLLSLTEGKHLTVKETPDQILALINNQPKAGKQTNDESPAFVPDQAEPTQKIEFRLTADNNFVVRLNGEDVRVL